MHFLFYRALFGHSLSLLPEKREKENDFSKQSVVESFLHQLLTRMTRPNIFLFSFAKQVQTMQALL